MNSETQEITSPATDQLAIIRFGESSHIADRNKKILEMLSVDKRPKEIAKELFLSIATVRWSIKCMMNLNGFHTVSALVASAIRKNMI